MAWFPLVSFAVWLVAVGYVAFGLNLSVVGEPKTDFLVATAFGVVFLALWLWKAKRTPRPARLAGIAVCVAAPILALVVADVDVVRHTIDLVRGQPKPPPYVPPPPPKYEYEAPKSSRVPDLAATTPFDWPGYRGAKSDGRAYGGGLARDWKKRPPRVLWSHPLGGGVSSPVIVGEFVVNHEQRGPMETVACYELTTGKECWAIENAAAYYEGNAGTGPRATPTVAHGAVFALGGRGLLQCLDGAAGKAKWSAEVLGKDVNPPGFGLAASPIVADGMVVVSRGMTGPALAAYNARTGKLVWEANGPPPSYASPIVVDNRNRREVWMFSTTGLDAYDLESGGRVWRVDWVNRHGERNNICLPIPIRTPTGLRVFLSSGYDVGCGLYAVPAPGDTSPPKELWKNKSLKCKYSSAIALDGLIVGLDEQRLLIGVELETGNRLWKHPDRFGDGQIVEIDGLLIVQDENGKLTLGQATAKGFEEFGEFDPQIGRGWNVPALAGRILVVRSTDKIVCLELPTVGVKPANATKKN